MPSPSQPGGRIAAQSSGSVDVFSVVCCFQASVAHEEHFPFSLYRRSTVDTQMLDTHFIVFPSKTHRTLNTISTTNLCAITSVCAKVTLRVNKRLIVY